MQRFPIIWILFACLSILFISDCKKETTTEPPTNDQLTPEAYFPLKPGLSWSYRVTFPSNVSVPYLPVIESPQGLLASSITHGMRSWTQGTVDFTVATTTAAESSSSILSYETVLSENAYKFFFYLTGDYPVQLRRKKVGDAFFFDIIGNLPVAVPYWKIARLVCKLSADSIKNTVDVTVPAGVFKGCVKTSVALAGDGSYVPSGTYPTELYLAPNKGIVKMIGKDKNGSVLYTMELVETSSPVSPTANYSGRWTGTYSSNLISSVSAIFDISHTGSTITGTYSASNGAAGTITGTVATTITFALTQTISACPGSFTGEGTVNVDTMNFTFSGTDCLGTHSNGKGRVQRQSTTSTGTLVVSSTPSGAQVVLDGTSTGKTTPATITSVTAGSHSVKLSLSGYADTTVSVTVATNQTTSVSLTLRQTVSTGSLYVYTAPSGAIIYLDGATTGQSTPATLLNVATGQRSVKLTLGGYADTTFSATVLQGQTAYFYVTLRQVSSSSDSIFIKMKVLELPKTLKFNQSHVPDYYTEHQWGIYFDADNNSSTGLNGYDIEISFSNYKQPGSSPYDGSPITSTSHQVIEWTGNSGYVRHSNVKVRLDPTDSNVILISAPRTWTEIAAIDAGDRFYFSAYYYDSTRSFEDVTIVSTGTGVVTDPSGDIKFPFADIVSGQWNFTGFLAWAGYQLIPTELRPRRITTVGEPTVPSALIIWQQGGQHLRVVR